MPHTISWLRLMNLMGSSTSGSTITLPQVPVPFVQPNPQMLWATGVCPTNITMNTALILAGTIRQKTTICMDRDLSIIIIIRAHGIIHKSASIVHTTTFTPGYFKNFNKRLVMLPWMQVWDISKNNQFKKIWKVKTTKTFSINLLKRSKNTWKIIPIMLKITSKDIPILRKYTKTDIPILPSLTTLWPPISLLVSYLLFLETSKRQTSKETQDETLESDQKWAWGPSSMISMLEHHVYLYMHLK